MLIKRFLEVSSLLVLLTTVTSPASAQTIKREIGNQHVTDELTTFLTPAPSLANSVVTLKYFDNSSQSFLWEDLGGNLGGIDNSLFRLIVDSPDVFIDPWKFTNLGNDVIGLEIYLAPGQTVFDLDDGGTPGSGDSGYEFELLDGTSVPFDTVTAIYSDIVAISGNPPVGDIYARLNIGFTEPIQAGQSVVFRNDLDSAVSEVIVVPEPSMVLGTLIALSFGISMKRKKFSPDKNYGQVNLLKS